MNFATHIFKKDIRHLRGLLIAWLVLVLLQTGLSGSGLAATSDSMVWEITFGIISFLIPTLQFLLILALVPLLIHEEPLVGTTAFWFTRPISRRVLLKSKALFCGVLLVLVPLLVELVVLAANRASPVQLGLAVPEILLNRLNMLLMVAALAVLTPSFARFVLFAVLGFVAYMVIYFVIYIVRLFINPMSVMSSAMTPSLMTSRMVVSSLVTLAGYGITVVHQYLTRRTARSVLLFVGTVVLSMAVPYLWPFDFMKTGIPPEQAVKVDANDIQLTLADRELNVSDHFRMSGKEGRKKQVNGTFRVQGSEPKYEYRTTVDSATFTFADGTIVKESETDMDYSFRTWDSKVLAHLLDSRVVGGNNGFSCSMNQLFSMDALEYDQQKDRSGMLEATVTVGVFRYVVTGSVPLAAGERISLGAEQTTIHDVLEDSTGCSVILRERTLNLMFDREEKREKDFIGRNSKVLYLLHNPVRRELALPDDDYNVNFNSMFGKNQRLSIESLRLKFGEQGRGRELSHEWLAEARLVRVAAEQVDEIKKELKADVRLGGSSGSCSSERKSKEEIGALLDKISLPENPTREQVREYIRAIDRASDGQYHWSSGDRQVAMYQEVGPENLDLLVEEIPDSYHLQYAVPPLIDDARKQWAIDHLLRFPWLAEVVWKNGWAEDARPELIAGLKDYADDVPVVWIKAVASFEDPSTYDDLVSLFVNQYNRSQTFRVIRKLDGIDLDDAVARAWKRAKYGQEFECNGMIPIAIAYGQMDALRIGIQDVLGGKDEDVCRREEIRKAVKKHTGQDGSDEEIVAWFAENGDHLVFNKETGLYTVSPEP